MLFSGGVGAERDGGVAKWHEFLERNNEAGNRIASLCHTRPSGSFLGLARQSFLARPAWQALMALPTIADRVDALRDSKTRDDSVEICVSRLLQSEGRELLNWWAFGNALENPWKYMQVPYVIPMLGDAGAHVGVFTDADSPTVGSPGTAPAR